MIFGKSFYDNIYGTICSYNAVTPQHKHQTHQSKGDRKLTF